MGKKITQVEAENNVLTKCKEKGYELVESFIYNGNLTRIKLKCNKDNHIWDSSYANFIRDKGCPKCGGSLNLTQYEVEKNIKEKCYKMNYTLLQPFIYINVKTKIHLKCNVDGYEWSPTYNKFINSDQGCKKCNNNIIPTQIEAIQNINNSCEGKNISLIKPFIYECNTSKLYVKCNCCDKEWTPTYVNFIHNNGGCKKCKGSLSQNKANENVSIRCKEMNYTLIKTFKYIGGRFTRLELKCGKDGHEWNVSYLNFIIYKNNCPKCSGRARITQNEAEYIVFKKCEIKNYTLIETFNYIDTKSTRLKLKCKIDNYVWNTSFNNFINGDKGCPKCGGSLPPTQKEVEIKVIKKCQDLNYTILKSFVYKNSKTRLHIKCNIAGHEWHPSCNTFINTNHGCPKCNESKGEIEIKKILEINNIHFVREFKFENCKYKNKLPFDFYLPKHNICIEFDGKQHYTPIERYGGQKTFSITQIRDAIKTQYCLDNGIKLIRIRYDESIEERLKEIFD